MNPCCPDPTPNPCPQVCTPKPPLPPCHVKPIMRGLHKAQTKQIVTQAILASMIFGASTYFFINLPRRAKYKKYYEKGEFDDWADEMARKGLFQSVPHK